MIPEKMLIRCAADTNIENWTLKKFPIIPSIGDTLIIDGVGFSVIGREFTTSHGKFLDEGIVIILNPQKP